METSNPFGGSVTVDPILLFVDDLASCSSNLSKRTVSGRGGRPASLAPSAGASMASASCITWPVTGLEGALDSNDSPIHSSLGES